MIILDIFRIVDSSVQRILFHVNIYLMKCIPFHQVSITRISRRAEFSIREHYRCKETQR